MEQLVNVAGILVGLIGIGIEVWRWLKRRRPETAGVPQSVQTYAQQAIPTPPQISVMRRWVGPWLWAIVQTWVIVNAVMVIVDLQGWVDRMDPEHAPHTTAQLANAPTNAVLFAVVAAWINTRIALRHTGPIALRIRVFAMYVPLNTAVAGGVIAVHYRTVGPNFIDQLSLIWGWWLVVVGAVVGLTAFFALREK